MIDAHRALRDGTKSIHEELHEHPAFRALFDRSISVTCYTDLMAQFYRFYEHLDPLIFRATRDNKGLAGTQGFDYQHRAPMFAKDLAHMGIDATEFGSPVELADRSSINSTSTLAGVLYVVEGSVLGGATMNKAIGRLPYEADVLGRSYWAWCAQHGKARWKATLRYLSSAATTETCVHEMVGAAQSTFQSMATYLAPVSIGPAAAEPLVVA